MRVLVITNTWPSSAFPYRVIVYRQVQALRRLGITVDVLRVEGGESTAEYLRAAARVLRLNLSPTRYDVVHTHSGHCGLLGLFQLRSPVVLSYMGYDLDGALDDRPGRKLEQVLFRGLSLCFAGTIAKSSRGRAALPTAARGRNTVVPNGVDRELFAPQPRSESRRRLGWDDSTPIVLFAADPSRFVKRFDLAEAAVAVTRERIPDVKLVVGGAISPDEMPTWMSAADVLLLTSYSEGSPNVVKEAMACDLPVISTDVGDVAELIEGARHCHVCPADPAALGEGLAEALLAAPERSDGRKRTAHLDEGEIARRIERVYQQASGRRPGMLGFISRRGAGVAPRL